MNQRQNELNMSQDEWYAVWMLGRMKRRKKMDNFKFQALRDLVKKGRYDFGEKFEKIQRYQS